jgi:hypothetical protein
MYRLSPIGKESVFMQIDFSKENLMVSSAFIVGEIKYKSDHFKYHQGLGSLYQFPEILSNGHLS